MTAQKVLLPIMPLHESHITFSSCVIAGDECSKAVHYQACLKTRKHTLAEYTNTICLINCNYTLMDGDVNSQISTFAPWDPGCRREPDSLIRITVPCADGDDARAAPNTVEDGMHQSVRRPHDSASHAVYLGHSLRGTSGRSTVVTLIFQRQKRTPNRVTQPLLQRGDCTHVH